MRLIMVLLIAILVSACASTASVSVTASRDCLPPGVDPSVLTWPAASTQPLPLPTGTDTIVIAQMANLIGPDGRQAVTIRVQGVLVVIDLFPGKAESSYWIDRGYVSADSQHIVLPPVVRPCQWRLSSQGSPA